MSINVLILSNYVAKSLFCTFSRFVSLFLDLNLIVFQTKMIMKCLELTFKFKI